MMDRFDKVAAVLLAVTVVLAAGYAVLFSGNEAKDFDEFVFSAGDGAKYATTSEETHYLKNTYAYGVSSSGYTFYHVNSVNAGTVNYSLSYFVEDTPVTVNSSAQESEFLKFVESDYTSLPYFKSHTVKSTMVTCEYRTVNATCHTIICESDSDSAEYSYKATYRIYVSGEYVVYSDEAVVEKDGDSEYTLTSVMSLNDLYLAGKTAKYSNVSDDLKNFALSVGSVLTWSVNETSGASEGQTDTEDKYTDKYTVTDISGDTVSYTLVRTLSDSTETETSGSMPLGEFTGLALDGLVSDGYIMENIAYEDTDLGDLGTAKGIRTVLTKTVGTTDYTEAVTTYNGQSVKKVSETQDDGGAWTKVTKTLVAVH